ncbi:MAG: hypothetical protein AAGB24_11070 [Bacteroidota bacterium]
MTVNNIDEAGYNKKVKADFQMQTTPDALVTETVKLLNTLQQTTLRYQYNVPKIQNANAIVFSMSLKPKDGTNGGLHMEKEELSIPIINNFTIEASTGFYSSPISNAKYSLRDSLVQDTVVSKIIVRDRGTGKTTIGAAAFIHPSYRVSKNIRLIGSLGFGSSTELNYSLLLGGGIMIGQRNRLAISAGWNYSSVKTISNKYLPDQSGTNQEQVVNGFNLQSKEVTGVDRVNTMKESSFFSVSYSFGFKKPQQAAESASDSETDKEETK